MVDGPLTGAPLNFPSPGGAGAACCPPQLKAQSVDADINIDGGDPAVVVSFDAGSCGLTEPLVASVRISVFGPPAILPAINSVTVAPGPSVEVEFDTQGADGAFVLEIANDCGCCTILSGFVSNA